MVDRAARDRAISVLTAYVRNEITNDDFAYQFPESSVGDAALFALESMLRNTQADLSVHKYGNPAEEVSRLYKRSILFLRTELEYEWPKRNLVGLGGGATLWELLSLGLIDRSSKRHEEFMRNFGSSGDFSVWPFIRREHFDAAVEAHGPM